MSACLTSPSICVDRDASIDERGRLFGGWQIRRPIVVDAYGACRGIIVQADHLRLLTCAVRQRPAPPLIAG